MQIDRQLYTYVAHTLSEYRRVLVETQVARAGRLLYELSIVPPGNAFSVEGFCYPCGAVRELSVSIQGHRLVERRVYPPYREQLICSVCRCCCRHRSSVHLIHEHLRINRDAAIYITEMLTPTYPVLKRDFPNLIGSEYLGDKVGAGEMDDRGVPNQDVTRLTFADDSLDAIWSFDVLEHVPDFGKGLSEFYRCLKPGGSAFITVPFLSDSQQTLVRARLVNGEVQHLAPAEYHGSDLCYYHFGWDFLDMFRDLGFRDAYGLDFWSRDYGCLGQGMVAICATK